jgi:hypothetical protein
VTRNNTRCNQQPKHAAKKYQHPGHTAVTSQKTPFCIVTAVKTASLPTYCLHSTPFVTDCINSKTILLWDVKPCSLVDMYNSLEDISAPQQTVPLILSHSEVTIDRIKLMARLTGPFWIRRLTTPYSSLLLMSSSVHSHVFTAFARQWLSCFQRRIFSFLALGSWTIRTPLPQKQPQPNSFTHSTNHYNTSFHIVDSTKPLPSPTCKILPWTMQKTLLLVASRGFHLDHTENAIPLLHMTIAT